MPSRTTVYVAWMGLALWIGGACSESEFALTDTPPEVDVGELSISGQVCDVETQTWLANAMVYTHLYDDSGRVYDTRETTTDGLGRWTLPDLVGGFNYEIYIQKGHDIIEQFIVELPADADLELPAPECFGEVDMKVAVITGSYDDLEEIFGAIGIASYQMIDGQAGDEIVDFLADPANLEPYDILFFNGGHKEDGVIYGSDPSVATSLASLQTYVQGGGVVWASDWAYDVVEQAWPDKIDFFGDDSVPDSAQLGEPGDVAAEVIDSGLQSAIGMQVVQVTYDMSVWPVIEEVDPSVTVLLQGDADYRVGMEVFTLPQSPLLASFNDGDGQVILMTWRNAVNGANSDMLSVLHAMIESVSP